MKILLSFIICSQVAATCMKPVPHPTTFDTQYNCLIEGYKQSIVKMEQICIINVMKEKTRNNNKQNQVKYSSQVSFLKTISVFMEAP